LFKRVEKRERINTGQSCQKNKKAVQRATICEEEKKNNEKRETSGILDGGSRY